MTFGAGFLAAQPLLGPLALVMTGAAVLNVHITASMAAMSKQIGRGILALALLDVALLLFLHDDAAHIVLATGITVSFGLVVIELTAPSGVVRVLRNRRTATRVVRLADDTEPRA